MRPLKKLDQRERIRRKVGLEVLSLTVPVAGAVGWSLTFLTGTSTALALGIAVTVLVMLALSWGGYRHRNAPAITAVADEGPDVRSDAGTDDDADGRWERLTGSLMAAGVVLVVAVVAIVTRFLLPLLVVTVFALASSPSSLSGFVMTVACTIALGLVVELGVVAPLGRRWDLDVDEAPVALLLSR